MRVLLDTDVILDVLLNRPQFVDQAAGLWEAHEQGREGRSASPYAGMMLAKDM